MAYDKNPELRAHTQHQKSIFVFRVIRIEVSDGILIIEYFTSFLEGYSILLPVDRIFGGILNEAHYNYVIIKYAL